MTGGRAAGGKTLIAILLSQVNSVILPEKEMIIANRAYPHLCQKENFLGLIRVAKQP